MKIIITGGKGMLGRTLQEELCEHELIIADLDNCDITNADKVESFFQAHSPDVVIHCAAMTAVDACETQEEAAYAINALGSKNVAIMCEKYNAKLIAFSTDYVFEGNANLPYNELDIPNPQTVYGKSKYQGELFIQKYCANHIIARISWLYGNSGPSFVHKMLELADGNRAELKVIADQIGNPTSTVAVARHLRLLLEKPQLHGIFHLTCEGDCSWFEFAQRIFQLTKVTQKVVPCTTAEYPLPAPRPANSRLDKMMLRKSGLSPMPNWQDALAEFLETK